MCHSWIVCNTGKDYRIQTNSDPTTGGRWLKRAGTFAALNLELINSRIEDRSFVLSRLDFRLTPLLPLQFQLPYGCDKAIIPAVQCISNAEYFHLRYWI